MNGCCRSIGDVIDITLLSAVQLFVSVTSTFIKSPLFTVVVHYLKHYAVESRYYF